MKKGFTLVELMIVMAILSSLVGLVAGGFRSAQIRGRDAQRKSDLKQIANALELFTSDYNKYPDDTGGVIVACPYNSGGISIPCAWGSGSFNDVKTVYLKTVPKDPSSGLSYLYRIVPGSNNLKFQIFTHLENKEDGACIGDNCTAPPGITYMCGGSICNFAVTSSNTNYSE